MGIKSRPAQDDGVDEHPARDPQARCAEGCEAYRYAGVRDMTEPRITLIPLPVGLPRVETGAVQFQDDWPGLFVRGDNAIALERTIRHLIERLEGHADPLVRLELAQLQHIADLIERDVHIGSKGRSRSGDH